MPQEDGVRPGIDRHGVLCRSEAGDGALDPQCKSIVVRTAKKHRGVTGESLLHLRDRHQLPRGSTRSQPSAPPTVSFSRPLSCPFELSARWLGGRPALPQEAHAGTGDDCRKLSLSIRKATLARLLARQTGGNIQDESAERLGFK